MARFYPGLLPWTIGQLTAEQVNDVLRDAKRAGLIETK